MAGLVLILTFILSISFAACTFPGTSNFSSLKENKSQVVKFGISISNRPINQKYSLAFTMEPAEKDLPLRKGKVAVGTKTRTRVRIILDIPKGVKDEKEKPVLISFVQKSRDTGGMSTFQTTGRGDLPMEAKLILKDLSSKTLDAVQFKVLGEWKENDENSGNLQTSVEKQFGINESRFYTEPAILELEMSTGSFCSSVVTILNEEAQPLHIKGYLHYILVKSSPSSFSSQESKGYSSDSVMIEPSELELQPGEKRKISIICQVPQEEEERYYARVVLELDFPEEEAGADIKQGATEELSPPSQKLKEISSNPDEPLNFMIIFKDHRAVMEEITLVRQIDFVFPDGIRALKGTYNKRLSSGKYIAEVSFKHGDKMLISQSSRFCVE